MRGLKTLEGLRHEGGYERVDLRSYPEAAETYVVWNIEDLGACPALQGRTFDLVVSC